MGTATGSQGCVDRQQARESTATKENLQSPLHAGAGDGSETGSLY